MTISKIASTAAPVIAKPAKNILFTIQELVARINKQLSRLSEEGQTRSQTMKKEYRISCAKAANIQEQVGNASPITSGLSFLSMAVGSAASYVFGAKADTLAPICKVISEQVPSVGQWYTSNLIAKQMREQSISQLRQTEISNEGQKSGEARDFQSELQQIIAGLRDLFKKASG